MEEKKHNILIDDVEGNTSTCFDTGLDPRSFARTKTSQSLVEPGYIVFPGGKTTVWKSTSVNVVNNCMRVWGPAFNGERLDLIINRVISPEPDSLDSSQLKPQQDEAAQAAAQQAAVQAVVYWIRAKLLLGDTNTSLSPGAALISCKEDSNKGSVFFTPENLSYRCLYVEGAEPNYYYCPDLYGTDAVAFCAAAMLYRILTKNHPYPDTETVYQDMREGVFLPPNLASPGLDNELSNLIKSALLLPGQKKRTRIEGNEKSGADILSGLLNKLLADKEGKAVSVSSLFHELTNEEKTRIKKDINFYNKGKVTAVKANRFVKRNIHALALATGGFLLVLFIAMSMIRTRSNRPSTAGLYPDTVVHTYYEAFNSLNHMLMEACINGAAKTDIDAAVNLFVIDKVRQSYGNITDTSIISARVWLQQGNELPAPNVFGLTNIIISQSEGSEREGRIVFNVEYTVWFPHEPVSSIRNDRLTLLRDKRRNWRITEINRNERLVTH